MENIDYKYMMYTHVLYVYSFFLQDNVITGLQVR